MSTKIHALVDALGNPLRLILTPGQVNDITQAEQLIAELPADHILADKGYDSKALRETIVNQGRGFGKRMGGLDLSIGELIEPPRWARDRVFPDKTRQGLRSDAFCHEILKPEHSPGFQEIESAGPLGAC